MIIRVLYVDNNIYTSNDVDLGLTKFCESRDAIIAYAFIMAIMYCKEHNVDFISCDIISE